MKSIVGGFFVGCGLVAALLFSSGEASAELAPHVQTKCVSSSGMSHYDLNISLPLKNGQIRYQYMGQDILYSVRLHEVSDDLIRGRADFQSSASGETRGNSFDFKYEPNLKRFSEVSIEASCS